MNDLPGQPGGVVIVNTVGIRNNGTFRWDDAKDLILLREIRVVEPYLGKTGSKEAGQGWTDVAKLVNTYSGFKDMPRDQRSVRERFNKLLGDFRAKMKAEENASGISPKPPTEVEILLEEMSDIMLNTVHPEKHKEEKQERAKALAVRNAAMNTWSKTTEAKGISGDEADDGSIEGDSKDKSKRGRKRRSSGDPLEYLRIKTQESMIIQQQEIELRKQQAILEKQKLEAKEKQQQQKQEELILQQQKMNQLLESQQKQFNMQQQQMQMQMQMQMQTQAAMMAVLEKLAKY